MLRPVSTSWSMCQLTKDTNLMETLKGRSFPPSPGRVTSRSTCRGGGGKKRDGTKKVRLHLVRVESVSMCVCRVCAIQVREIFLCFYVYVCLSSSHPCGCHRQWVGCVQAPLSIIDWPAIPKDCHLKVLHHRVNHLPAQHTHTKC